MFDPVDMMYDYEVFSKQKLELFNLLIKIDLGQIKRENLPVPVGIIEQHYRCLDAYTSVLALSLGMMDVPLPKLE